MKQWYAMEPELQDKYGLFPAWWKDLQTWPHWRPVYKLYLRHTEKQHENNYQLPTSAPAPDPSEFSPSPVVPDAAAGVDPSSMPSSMPMPMPPPSTPAPASGWLYKKGGGTSMFGSVRWSKRWCMLNKIDDASWSVQWWGKEDDSKVLGAAPKGELMLSGCEVASSSETDNMDKFYFDVTSADGDSIRHFYATSEESRAGWMESIAYHSRAL